MEKMTKCKACGKDIAKGAKICPSCGKDQRNFFMKHKIITIILVLIIFGAIGAAAGGGKGNSSASNNNNQSTSTTSSSAPAKDESIKEGMYKIGSDLPAGEYVVVSDANGYMQVSKDSTGDINSIIANDNIQNRTIVTVKDGQYFEIKNGKAYPYAKAPKVIAKDNVLPSGMYKVGVDLPAGEYKVSADSDGYFEVDKDSSHDVNSIVANDNFSGEKYVTVQAGQYLKLGNATLKLK